jgi:DNA-binding response OmpR family regulator
MQHILVVDDDPMVCMAIEIYLERHGFQVTIADGGEAGLRVLDGTTFDLMSVDICRICAASNRSGFFTSAHRRCR